MRPSIAVGLALSIAIALASGTAAAPAIEALCPAPFTRCLDYSTLASIVDEIIVPLPDGQPGPLRAPAGGWSQFGRAQPPTPVWNPPGRKRVGLQAGHYQFADAPDEQRSLRSNPGAPGGGRAEWQVTIEVAELAAEMLRAEDMDVDVLPTTIPVRYRAHAFVSIHVDGSDDGRLNGYKVARPNFSSIPDVDDTLAEIVFAEYGRVTGRRDDSTHISGRMRNYYAFNAGRYQHAVAPGVPQLIVETGFMSNWADREFLFSRPDVAARGIADGVLRFLALDIV